MITTRNTSMAQLVTVGKVCWCAVWLEGQYSSIHRNDDIRSHLCELRPQIYLTNRNILQSLRTWCIKSTDEERLLHTNRQWTVVCLNAPWRDRVVKNQFSSGPVQNGASTNLLVSYGVSHLGASQAIWIGVTGDCHVVEDLCFPATIRIIVHTDSILNHTIDRLTKIV